LYQELLHVPLVFKLPNRKTAKRIENFVTTQALLPTVLDIVGIDANHQVGFLENMLHVRFRWRNLNDPFPKCDDARAVSVIEADGNASWDLVVARSESTELWRTVTSAAGIRFVAAVPAKGTANKMRAGDWNNDGLETEREKKRKDGMWTCVLEKIDGKWLYLIERGWPKQTE
jgi:hypothetical protein